MVARRPILRPLFAVIADKSTVRLRGPMPARTLRANAIAGRTAALARAEGDRAVRRSALAPQLLQHGLAEPNGIKLARLRALDDLLGDDLG